MGISCMKKGNYIKDRLVLIKDKIILEWWKIRLFSYNKRRRRGTSISDDTLYPAFCRAAAEEDKFS